MNNSIEQNSTLEIPLKFDFVDFLFVFSCFHFHVYCAHKIALNEIKTVNFDMPFG